MSSGMFSRDIDLIALGPALSKQFLYQKYRLQGCPTVLVALEILLYPTQLWGLGIFS